MLYCTLFFLYSLRNSAFRDYKFATGVNDAPQESYSYWINADSAIPLVNITIPQYSKGIFVSDFHMLFSFLFGN